jgi:hypothetical protein
MISLTCDIRTNRSDGKTCLPEKPKRMSTTVPSGGNRNNVNNGFPCRAGLLVCAYPSTAPWTNVCANSKRRLAYQHKIANVQIQWRAVSHFKPSLSVSFCHASFANHLRALKPPATNILAQNTYISSIE